MIMRSLVVVMAVLAFLVAACGSDDTGNSSRRTGEPLSEEEIAAWIAELSEEIAAEPDNPLHYIERGDVYLFDAIDYSAAIDDFDAAIALDDRLFWAYSGRGIAHLYRGFVNMALEDFDVAVSIEPDEPFGYTLRGISHLVRSRTAEAIAELDTAIELYPNDAIAHFYRSVAYRMVRRFDLAESDLDSAVNLNPRLPGAY